VSGKFRATTVLSWCYKCGKRGPVVSFRIHCAFCTVETPTNLCVNCAKDLIRELKIAVERIEREILPELKLMMKEAGET